MNPTLPLTSRDFVFVDLETTGLNPKVHEIIEIAALRMTPNLQAEKARLDMKCTMVQQDVAEAKALEVNRYSALDWKGSKPVRVALVDLAPMIDDDVILVGHNVHFDVGFLREEYERAGLTMPKFKYAIDTVSIVFPLAMQGHISKLSLETICARYGIHNDGQHRAMADVMRTVRAFAKLLAMPEPRFGVPPPAAEVQRDVKPANVVLSDPFAGVPHEEEVPEWAR